jgi:hypothetical protein
MYLSIPADDKGLGDDLRPMGPLCVTDIGFEEMWEMSDIIPDSILSQSTRPDAAASSSANKSLGLDERTGDAAASSAPIRFLPVLRTVLLRPLEPLRGVVPPFRDLTLRIKLFLAI